LLDTDSGSSREIAEALLDLRGINRNFGGIGTLQQMVEHISGKLAVTSFTLLEVASGLGYVPQTVRQRLERSGIRLQITLLDRALSHLPSRISEDSTPGNNFAPIPAVVADAMVLPFPDGSFDFVDSSLFAHHLSPQELVEFVTEGLRVCRVAVLINDLVRSPVHLGLVYAGLPLFQSRITRHDAPASVRGAYTPAEVTDLVQKTTAARVEIQRHYLFRMGVIVWKR
jgi:ubiquinone/menaquinone biosynthesis C-methylase UbiE